MLTCAWTFGLRGDVLMVNADRCDGLPDGCGLIESSSIVQWVRTLIRKRSQTSPGPRAVGFRRPGFRMKLKITFLAVPSTALCLTAWSAPPQASDKPLDQRQLEGLVNG